MGSALADIQAQVVSTVVAKLMQILRMDYAVFIALVLDAETGGTTIGTDETARNINFPHARLLLPSGDEIPWGGWTDTAVDRNLYVDANQERWALGLLSFTRKHMDNCLDAEVCSEAPLDPVGVEAVLARNENPHKPASWAEP